MTAHLLFNIQHHTVSTTLPLKGVFKKMQQLRHSTEIALLSILERTLEGTSPQDVPDIQRSGQIHDWPRLAVLHSDACSTCNHGTCEIISTWDCTNS